MGTVKYLTYNYNKAIYNAMLPTGARGEDPSRFARLGLFPWLKVGITTLSHCSTYAMQRLL